MNTAPADLDIPAFLDRSKWSPAQHTVNAAAWDARIARRLAEVAAESAATQRKRRIEKIENRLAGHYRRRDAGTILPFEERAMRSLERQLEEEKSK